MKKIFTLGVSLTLLSVIHAQFPQLWAATASGATNGKGDIFNILGDGTNFNAVYDFGTITDDGYNYWYSQSSLVHAGDGKLYGKNTEGGANGSASFAGGIIFSYDPVTSTYKDVYLKLPVNNRSPAPQNVEQGFLFEEKSLCRPFRNPCLSADREPAFNPISTLKWFHSK